MRNDNNKKLQEALALMSSEVHHVFVDDLSESIDRAIEKARGEKAALVESVTPFIPEEKQKLENILVNILKRRIRINYSLKPNLLGGFRVSVGDWKLDGTLANQLNKIKSQFGVK